MFEVGWWGSLRGILKVSLAPAFPHKNFNRAHTGTNTWKAYLLKVLQEMMQCRAVGYRQVEMMSDNKIYSESLIENILPTKFLYGRKQCQAQFHKPFSLLQLNWNSLFCVFILGEIS